MGSEECAAPGFGGYVWLVVALSVGECVMIHSGRQSTICSDALAKVQ